MSDGFEPLSINDAPINKWLPKSSGAATAPAPQMPQPQSDGFEPIDMAADDGFEPVVKPFEAKFSDVGKPTQVFDLLENKITSEPPAPIVAPTVKDEISQGQKPGVVDNLKSFFRQSPEESKAKAANIYALSKVTGMPMLDVQKNYDQLIRDHKITGIMPNISNKEYMAAVMAPAIAAGAITNPLLTAGGLIGFAALDKAIPTEKFIPEDASDTTKTAIELADFIGKSMILGGFHVHGPKVIERFTKDKLTEYKLPTTVSLSPEQVRDIFQTGKLTTPEQSSLFGALNLSRNQLKTALKNGININIPVEKITTIVDKPYWAKIKGAFGLKPFEAKFSDVGKPTQAFDLLENKSSEPITSEPPAPIVAPPAPNPLAPPQILPATAKRKAKDLAPNIILEKPKRPWEMSKEEYEATSPAIPYEQMISEAKSSVAINDDKNSTRPLIKVKLKVGTEYGKITGEKKDSKGFLKKGYNTTPITSEMLQSAYQDMIDNPTITTEEIDGATYVTIQGPAKPASAIKFKNKKMSKLFNASTMQLDLNKANVKASDLIKAVELNNEPFKLSEAVKNVMKRYTQGAIGEGFVPKGVAGAYYSGTKNVFLNALGDVFAAIHETSHALADFHKTIVKIYTPIGRNKIGGPIYDPKTLLERKLFTEAYIRYYNGKKNHPLETRIEEGYAAFITHAAHDAEATKKTMPVLWDMVMEPNGKYYNSVINSMYRDFLNEVILPYKMLSPSERIASVLTHTKGESQKSYLNWQEQLVTNIGDDLLVIKKLEQKRKLGIHSPLDQFRLYRNVMQWVEHNVGNYGFLETIFEKKIGAKGSFIGLDLNGTGTPANLLDFNYGKLIESVPNLEDFDTFLLAYSTKFNYDKLDVLESEALQAVADRASIDIQEKNGEIGKTEARNRRTEAQSLIDNYEILKGILSAHQVSRADAEFVYNEKLPEYAQALDMYEKLKRVELDMKRVYKVITPKAYEAQSRFRGYATWFRDFENEVIGSDEFKTGVTRGNIFASKPSSTKQRTGSKLDIKGILYNSIVDHMDIMRKVARRAALDKLINVIAINPGEFQIADLDVSYNPETRVVRYPQEYDKSFIVLHLDYNQMKHANAISGGAFDGWFKNHKPDFVGRVPFKVNAEIGGLIEEAFIPLPSGFWSKMSIGLSSGVVKGSTLYNPIWAIKNIVMDQPFSWYNSEHNYIPFIEPVISISRALANDKSPDATHLKEYIMYGAEKHSIYDMMNMDPQTLYQYHKRELRGMNFFLHHLEYIGTKLGDALALLGKMSELLTRFNEYNLSRKAGDPINVAMEKAGQISGSYHHRGRYWRGGAIRTIFRSLPYRAARVQILMTAYRSAERDPFKAATRMGIIASAAVGAFIYYMSAASDEQKNEYGQISARDKANYIHIPMPDGKTILKVPIGSELSFFATMFNMFLEDKIMNHNITPDEYVNGAFQLVGDDVYNVPAFALNQILYPLVKIPLSLVINSNLDHPGAPLVPDYMRVLPREDRVNAYTSPLSKAFVDAMPANWDVSPIQLDMIIKTTLGGAAGVASGRTPINFELAGNPFIHKKTFAGSRDVRKYYEQRESTELGKNVRIRDLSKGINVNNTDLNTDIIKYFSSKPIEKMLSVRHDLIKYDLKQGIDPAKDETILNMEEIIKKAMSDRVKFFEKKP